MPILLVLLAAAPGAVGQETDEPIFPIVASGIGAAEIGGARLPLEFSTTIAGPLVALRPLVPRLGGRLEEGPLGNSATLVVGDSSFVFGTANGVVTDGEKLLQVAQPPLPGGAGLLVPVELLEVTYGQLLGFEFEWLADEKLLRVRRQEPRDLPVTLDAVNLQGVTTLVFQFPSRPRYTVERQKTAVTIRMAGDRLLPQGGSPSYEGGLVRGVDLESDGIRIRLAPGATAKEYSLENPFRLVLDVFRDDATPPAAAPPPRPQRARNELRTIVIDPGHGGSDTGARGPGGTLEKDLTLILARTLKRRLESRLPVKVVLTRGEDAELPLDTRTAVANQQKADLFISIHLNSSVAGGATGAETYFLSLEATDELAARTAEAENRAAVGGGAGDPLHDLQLILWDLAQTHYLAESQRIAALIQEELNLTLSLRNRGVKQAPFAVLMGAAMPAVLVELGFLTNREEEERLNDPEYRARLADTLVRAISRYRAALRGDEIASSEASR